MKTKNLNSAAILFLLVITLAIGCKQENKNEEGSDVQAIALPESMAADTVAMSSNAARIGKADANRKFIRTADLKFKVKDVIKTTYAIENIAARLDGFVTYTNLESKTNNEVTQKITGDSSVVTRYFTVENNMIIRVPNTRLDSTLKAIAPLIDHLDFRVIKADDVSLRMLSNDMDSKRSAASQKRLTAAIDNKGRRLNDITTAEDALVVKKQQADIAKLENMSLNDQVNFSTINIAMYQREEIKRELIPNDETAKYTQSFGSRMMDAFYFGWEIITTLIVLIANLWAIILLSAILYFVLRKFRQGRNKK
ncbi:MAG TPA: DUF4349 domain-containing protein [Flavobacterium sp.]|jgi:hypothetical protein